MKFNIEDYLGDYVMHCPTEESVEVFTNYLQTERKWIIGTSYYSNNGYDKYWENTVYYFNEGLYGDIEIVPPEYNILEFYNFDWTDESPYEKSDITLEEVLELKE